MVEGRESERQSTVVKMSEVIRMRRMFASIASNLGSPVADSRRGKMVMMRPRTRWAA